MSEESFWVFTDTVRVVPPVMVVHPAVSTANTDNTRRAVGRVPLIYFTFLAPFMGRIERHVAK